MSHKLLLLYYIPNRNPSLYEVFILYLYYRIDINYVIKVSDFGLSEDVYARNYFHQGSMAAAGGPVRLHIKWLAPESLTDNLFSKKSDVVKLNSMFCVIQ